MWKTFEVRLEGFVKMSERKSTVSGQILKEGDLMKLGGGEGGRANWRKRYFVLGDDLSYYESKDAYLKGAKPKGIVGLNVYFVTENEDGKKSQNEFTIHSYPKNLTCRANDEDTMKEWVEILLSPLKQH